MATVSVIVPTYNSAAYLLETLESILRQEGVETEIIVIDDGSKDDTAAVIAGLAEPALRYLRLPENHGGPSRPRNVGVQAASGDFIALFDSDDIMLPGHLSRSARFLEANPEAGLVFSRGLRRYPDGTLAPHLQPHIYDRFFRLSRRAAPSGGWLLEREETFECLTYENFLLPSGVVLPRRLLEEIGPFDETLTNGDDRDFCFRIASRYPFGYLEEYGFYYRIREDSISTRGGELATNRIRVLHRQLKQPISPAVRRGLRQRIAHNYSAIGYFHQEMGEAASARRAFFLSFREAPNFNATRGILFNLLPRPCRHGLQMLRRLHASPDVPADRGMVSVVITCYNYGRYLAGCLESVLGQTYRNVEIILVNDGSTDHTDEVAAPFLLHPGITYIRQENRGQAAAKNVGITRARGEFIAFLDADDRWEPDKLERQMPLFGEPATGVVYSRARYMDAEGREADFRLSGKYLAPRAGRVSAHLFLDNFVPFSSAVVRRECFERAGIFDESLAMGIDWDLWLRVSVHYRFDYVDAPLLIYRVGHPGQMSRQTELRQDCSDRIMAGFIQSNPGFLSRRVLRRAKSNTFRTRAFYFRKKDLNKSCSYYLKAIKTSPLEWPSYRGLGKSVVLNLLRKSGRWWTKSKSPS